MRSGDANERADKHGVVATLLQICMNVQISTCKELVDENGRYKRFGHNICMHVTTVPWVIEDMAA